MAATGVYSERLTIKQGKHHGIDTHGPSRGSQDKKLRGTSLVAFHSPRLGMNGTLAQNTTHCSTLVTSLDRLRHISRAPSFKKLKQRASRDLIVRLALGESPVSPSHRNHR
jgi:hypothetical protein